MTDITRRSFTKTAAAVTGATIIGVGGAGAKEYETATIRSYNQNMEYRRLGKTGIMVSAVCLGGHWKRLDTVLGKGFTGEGYSREDFDNVNQAGFISNRTEIVSKCIDHGINYVDACAGPEILAYAKALKGRRDKMYFGYSWHVRESRYAEFQKSGPLLTGLDEGMREAGLDFVDFWRISLPMSGRMSLSALHRIEEGCAEALDRAKQAGKIRFGGVSTHNRTWLAQLIKQYPKQIEAVLFPYTAASKRLPKDSLFDVLKETDTGALGIKPFADNAIFLGDSSLTSEHREADDRRARMAIRYILNNPAITAPMAGLINEHQIDNVVRAIAERRELDAAEQAELETIGEQMWANLRPTYRWLRNWEYV